MKTSQRRMARPSLAGMLATRRGALLLALLCAACAAGILMFALGQYKTKVATVQPTVQATVLVATAPITKGTAGTAIAQHQLYKSTPVVASQVTPGAISDASALAGKVASANIMPGQQLTLADFTGVTGVSGVLTPDQRAISISISEAPGATDVLQPGDRVDIYAKGLTGQSLLLMQQNIAVIKQAGASVTTANGQVTSTPAAGSSSAQSSTTPSASTSASPASGSTVTGGAMVLAETADQASDLVYAVQQGATLYLTLRPPNATIQTRLLTNTASVLHDAAAVSTPTLNGVQH